VFSKSANPLDLRQKSTIRALFKAKSVDPKTFSPSSRWHIQDGECSYNMSIKIPCFLLLSVIIFSIDIFKVTRSGETHSPIATSPNPVKKDQKKLNCFRYPFQLTLL